MTSPALPPLSAIRCFEAAARHQSFTRAAEELGMTQAAMSYQIKLLEERVGSPLFKRGARGVTLTKTGRMLAPKIADAFSQLRSAFADMNRSADRALSITALSTLAVTWLLPRLGGFQRANPDIAVAIDTSNDLVDFSDGEFDVGIRSGNGEWLGLVAHSLFPAAFTPMLSPALAAQYPRLAAPADLLKLPLIDPHDPWWQEWFADAGAPAPDLSSRTGIRVDNQQMAARAAMSGQGVAVLMPTFFAEELAAGTLIQPFPLVRDSGAHYWLVYPEARRRSAKIRAFRDWILEEAASGEKRG
jgi:LysR family glycine cleavage system transcriptional activator